MKKISVMIIALALALQAAPVSDTCNQETWVTNGDVQAIVTDGNRVYIGGYFTQVGPSTGGGVPINSETGKLIPKFPKIHGQVFAVCEDGNGGWFVGGQFPSINNKAHKNIAHIFADGSLDPAWNQNPNGAVYSLAMSGTTLYVGGGFDSVNKDDRRKFAEFDSSFCSPVIQPASPPLRAITRPACKLSIFAAPISDQARP